MRTLSTVLLLVTSPLYAQDKAELRAVVSDSNTPPYAIFSADGSLQAGIAKDVIDELARLTQRSVNYLNLPRTRVESWLVEGKADLACFLNPDWVSSPDKLLWTGALFTTQQLLIRRHDTKALTGIHYLAGKRVGTTWGFTYPELEQVFRSGDVIRDDAHSLESNLQRLKQGRLDVVMTVDLSYRFYIKTAGDQGFAADPLWSESPAVYCALSKFQSDEALKLKQVFTQMVTSGFIQRQLAFYMGHSDQR